MLDGRELNNQTKEEIIELIKEDIGYAFDQQIEVAAINYTRCCTEFADGKCKPMVNADWTYLRCECGKRFEPKG